MNQNTFLSAKYNCLIQSKNNNHQRNIPVLLKTIEVDDERQWYPLFIFEKKLKLFEYKAQN